MKRIVLGMIMIVIAQSGFASQLDVSTGVWIDSPPDVNFAGDAFYTNDAGEPGVGVPMSGNLSLFNSWGDRVDNIAWTVYGGSWQGQYVETVPWNDCYTSAINAQTFDQSSERYSAARPCNPPPPNPPCHLNVYASWNGYITSASGTGDYPCGTYVQLAPDGTAGWDFVEWTGTVSSRDQTINVLVNTTDMDETADYWPRTRDGCGDDCSPIVVNLEPGSYRLTGTDDPVLFDIGATGAPIRTAWTVRGADEAFLWLDRNGNGIVDNGAELFGNATTRLDGTRAQNGFDALKDLDTNGDGVIDSNDMVWNQLLLWRDLNHDGVSQHDEIQSIRASEIAAISLDYHWSGRRDLYGNTFRYEAIVRLRSALAMATEHLEAKPLYDIFFAHGK